MKRKILLVSGILLVMLVMQAAGQPALPLTTTTSSIKELTTNRSLTRQGPAPIVEETYGTTSGDRAYAVIECSSGGYLLAGETSSYGAAGVDGWLIRTDADGNHLWNNTYGVPNTDRFYSVVECASGGFAMAGYSENNSIDKDMYLVRTDASGTVLWNKTFDSTDNDEGTTVIELSSGGFAIAGWTTGWDPNVDFWLVVTDTSGNHLFNKTYDRNTEDYDIISVVEVTSGGYLLAGSSYTVATDYDIWAVRTDASGTEIWNQTYGGASMDLAFKGVETPDGGFAFAGYSDNLDPSKQDAFLVKTDSSGNEVWNSTFGLTGYRESYDNMIVYPSGGFALVGAKENTTYGDNDILVVRLDAAGSHIWNSTFDVDGNHQQDRCYGIAECSVGFVLGGSPITSANGYQAWLCVIPDDVPPTWNPAPTDQTAMSGLPFSYDLNATDGQGLATWTINDTTNYAIDTDGVVTNAIVLAVGVYGLNVTVSDPVGNTRVGTFTVTVQALPPGIPGFPAAAIAIGVATALGLGLVKRRRKHL